MSWDLETPDTYESESPYLKEPGTYHVQVLDIQEGVSQRGDVIDGFSVTFGVLGGANHGKTSPQKILNAKDTASDNAKRISKQKQVNFAIAANLFDPNAVGTNKKVSIELSSALHQQMVVRFSENEGTDGKTYLQIDYAAIFHVDDPDVASVQKSSEHLSVLPSQCRKSADFFKYKAKKQGSASKPQLAGAASSEGKWKDL